MAKFVAGIDQGTTSTRCIVFDHAGTVVAGHPMEQRQIFLQTLWLE